MGAPVHLDVLAMQLCARIPGGTGRYTRELIGSLAKTMGPLDDVTAVVSLGCKAAADLPVQTRAIPLPVPLLARLWERGMPPAVGSAGRVVHAPTLLAPPTARGVPLIVTIHDAVPWTHPETLTPRGVAFHRRMAAWVAAEADVIVTPTLAVAASLRTILRPVARLEVVPPGAAALPVPSDAHALLGAAGVVRPFVLFVGTAEPRKALDVLVRAMADPVTDDLDLVVVGQQGWGGVDTPGLVAAAGIGSRVVQVGRVDDLMLAALYDGARVLAMPSRAEGFGLPVLEAMAAGLPVVVSDDPALVEVGGDAVAVTPVGDVRALAEGLAAAAADGDDRRRQVARGRERAAQFTWDSSARRLWRVYADLVESH